MNIPLLLLIGALVHGLIGATIFFAPEEPHKLGIVAATTIKGLLVSLLIGFSLQTRNTLLLGVGFGALYGFAFALVVLLAKGGFKHVPYILPSSVVQGIITGLLASWLAMRG
jgi:hypothetical protein